MKKAEVSKKISNLTEAELDRRVVNQLASAVTQLQVSWHQLFVRSFMAGLLTALGATIGLAVFITVLGYVLKWLGVVPGLSQLSQSLNDFLAHSAIRR